MPQETSLSNSVPAGFRLVRVVLGLVLLAAAALKAHALWVDPDPPLSLFSSPRWQIAFVELETVLGLWLLSGVSPRWACLAALGVFALFAGVSLYLGIVGSPSCGCFGRVSVNPRVTLAFDVAAVMALWRWCPRPLVLLGSTRGQLYVGLGLGVLLVVGSMALARMDVAPSAALARLRGESLVIEPPVADVGSGTRGEKREFAIQVRNVSDRPIRVIGGSANCNCEAIGDLPLVVPVGEARSLKVIARLVGPLGEAQQQYGLYTDDELQPVVLGRYARRLMKPSGR